MELLAITILSSSESLTIENLSEQVPEQILQDIGFEKGDDIDAYVIQATMASPLIDYDGTHFSVKDLTKGQRDF